MAKKRRKRITTSDPYDAKRLRIMAALHYDETKDKPNRELARLLCVDERTVRNYRKEFEAMQGPAGSPPKKAVKKKGKP